MTLPDPRADHLAYQRQALEDQINTAISTLDAAGEYARAGDIGKAAALAEDAAFTLKLSAEVVLP